MKGIKSEPFWPAEPEKTGRPLRISLMYCIKGNTRSLEEYQDQLKDIYIEASLLCATLLPNVQNCSKSKLAHIQLQFTRRFSLSIMFGIRSKRACQKRRT
jgi:hypothetical protein